MLRVFARLQGVESGFICSLWRHGTMDLRFAQRSGAVFIIRDDTSNIRSRMYWPCRELENSLCKINSIIDERCLLRDLHTLGRLRVSTADATSFADLFAKPSMPMSFDGLESCIVVSRAAGVLQTVVGVRDNSRTYKRLEKI